MNEFWRFDGRNIDSARFFTVLWKCFPEATTFYVEGTSISEDVRKCYEEHRQEGDYLPKVQTVWPVVAVYRCRWSEALADALAALGQRHAEPELLDHLALYRGTEEVVIWNDAFGDAILVARAVAEAAVESFARELGREVSQGEG